MTERELWEELVGCGGWALLTQRVLAYWHEQLTPHLAAAANDRDDVAALGKIRQVLASKRAAEQVLALPTEALSRLAQQQHKDPESIAEALSRRGGL